MTSNRVSNLARHWRRDQDIELERVFREVKASGAFSWAKVGQHFPERTSQACKLRIYKLHTGKALLLVDHWTSKELARLEECYQTVKRQQRGKVRWALIIVHFPNRSSEICQQQMHKIREARGEVKQMPPRKSKKAAPLPKPAVEPPLRAVVKDILPTRATSPHAPMSRGISVYRAMARAEASDVADRAARYGMGVALCGDPMPGRSALDKKRMGV